MKTVRIIFTPPLAFSLIMLLFLIVYVADVRATAMDAAFVEDKLVDTVYPAVEPELREGLGDLISEELTDQLGEEEAQAFSNAIRDSITDEWVENAAHNIITAVYDYLDSDSSTLNLTIPFSPGFKEGLKEALGVYFTTEATELSQEQIDAGLEAINRQVDDLPTEFTLAVENLDLSVLQNAVDIFDHFFIILIALAVLLAVLLIFLHFKLKDAVRVIGVCLLIGGVISLVVALVTISVADGRIDTVDWELSADSDATMTLIIESDTVMTVIRDSLHPAIVYSIILIVVGAVLVVFSFLWRYIVRWYETRRRPPLSCTQLPDESLTEV